MSFYREQLERYLKSLNIIADSVLDMGGGSNPVSGRVNTWNVKKYIILDNSLEEPKALVDIAADMNYEMTKEMRMLASSFDMIFCLEVFEYIFDPIVAMGFINRMLKKGGIAYISFPTIYPLHNPEGHDYLRYTIEGIRIIIHESGLKILDVSTREPTKAGREYLSNFYKSDGMHPRKGTEDIYATGYIVKVVK